MAAAGSKVTGVGYRQSGGGDCGSRRSSSRVEAEAETEDTGKGGTPFWTKEFVSVRSAAGTTRTGEKSFGDGST